MITEESQEKYKRLLGISTLPVILNAWNVLDFQLYILFRNKKPNEPISPARNDLVMMRTLIMNELKIRDQEAYERWISSPRNTSPRLFFMPKQG